MRKKATTKKSKALVKAKKAKTAIMIKTTKVAKKIKAVSRVKMIKRIRKTTKSLFTLGNLNSIHARILVLILLIIFMATFVLASQLKSLSDPAESDAYNQPPQIKKQSPLEKEITEMTEGYPIAKMMPYILKKDPKTAMFLVAIAKKESAWGKRKPVLDGQDCFNYWGFRLKAEKMGSGGHTCFDSPKEAVETVAQRIDQLVEEEDIDTPSDMIVWKCGYGCQDQPKSLSEKKWINDVDFYYSAMNEYL
ncbi:MAG: hypothetical protein ACD_14C00060G0003 [uncultured bacterium]|nr:MAG: hypothetical protein ACD_14C00060G0003 [uncultured bacterium]KKQ45699.1 MAG: hypothetical protein US63_C0012G0034 [Candidatus Moranbacteria bacterium GW2011_GWC2_37_8]KKQ62839.1 MAG: hypothetical protein US82_C0005G0012 [Parcubacteria group bacterium GW2011_GWC1_38_22]